MRAFGDHQALAATFGPSLFTRVEEMIGLFPLFLAMAAVLPPRAVPLWAAAFGLLQGLCAALFYTWRELF